jgi:hypothetical protein
VPQGGTGLATAPANGRLLIGNGTNYTLANLTAGAGVSITNGSGAITIASTGVTVYPGAGIPLSTGTSWGTSYGTTGTGTDVVLVDSPGLTGIPTAPTATPGTNSVQIATTAFVTAAAFSAALPGQTGNAGKFITTNGTVASWAYVPVGGIDATGTLTANTFLSGAGTWSAIPVAGINATGTLSANTFLSGAGTWSGIPMAGIAATGTPSSSNYLRGDGTWAVVSASTILPSQAGNAGKYLQTDGSNLSWQQAGGISTPKAYYFSSF